MKKHALCLALGCLALFAFLLNSGFWILDSIPASASKVGGRSWATFSDGRLKNVEGVYSAGGKELSQLTPVKYRYRRDNKAGIRDGAEHVGLIAQEVQAVIPEAVSTNNKGYLMLDNDPIIFAMLNAIKEQKMQLESQAVQIETLQMEVRRLSAEKQSSRR